MEKAKVLFVDDELITLKSFELYFKDDFDVVTARDGSTAMTLLEENKDMAVLITDYKMPQISGLQLIKQAKSIHPKLICVLVTGYTDTPEILEAKSDKILAETFTKPIDLQYLEQKIYAMLT
ncbi:MAG: response regulator [Cyclobacteriaceae bacterium]